MSTTISSNSGGSGLSILIAKPPSSAHAQISKNIAQLSSEFNIIMPESDVVDRKWLLEHIGEVDGAISFAAYKFDKEIIGAAKKLKVIAHYGAGYDSVDVSTATEKGIIVTNTPDVVSGATSDIAMHLILSTLRRTSEAEAYVRRGEWPKQSEQFLGRDPNGKTLGIIGMGNIGRLLAKKARAFDMKIIYYNRNQVSTEIETELQAKYVTLQELLATSDVISVNAPLTSETKHMLSAKEFSQMKKGVIIVNTARGSVINEDDLVEALESGQVGSAGLDVFEHEPPVHPKLLTMPNVTLLPHIGTCTAETRAGMWQMCLDNVTGVLRGKGPLTPVNSVTK